MRNMKSIVVYTMVLGVSLILLGCSGGNPKDMAKETYDLTIRAIGAVNDPVEAAKIEDQAAKLEKKVDKLSIKDKIIYETELLRLSGDALGDLYSSFGEAFPADELEQAGDSPQYDEDSLGELEQAIKDAAEALEAMN